MMEVGKLKPLLLCLACALSAPAHGLDCSTLASVKWLLGEWVAEDERTLTFERWRAVSRYTFEGAGKTVKRRTGDESSSESMRIVAMSGAVFYLAKVAHNPRPVGFALTECTETSASFENPEHDFPQRIVYEQQDEDRMTVTVSAGDEGFSIEFMRPAEDDDE